MYKINGRIEKENTFIKYELICEKCGCIIKNKHKEFGESQKCPKCDSLKLKFKVRYEK